MRKSNRIVEEMHEIIQRLYADGLIDKPRMRELEALYRANPVPQYTGECIKELRSRLNMSQEVLAAIIKTSAATVRSWEAGTKKPTGPSCKLLDILNRKGIEALL